MSNDIATLETEIKDYKLQLETLQPGLQADPDNVELQNLKAELEELISILESSLAELKPAPAPSPPQVPSPAATAAAAAAAATSPVVKEKWSRENHPAYQAGYRKPAIVQEEPQPTTFAVNDTVLAKWKSGDKAMWPAKITSITGSASKPVYLVRFKAGGDTETVFAHELKAMAGSAGAADSRKRKADGGGGGGGGVGNGSVAGSSSSYGNTPATPTTPSSTIPGGVAGGIGSAAGAGGPGGNPSNIISAAADINPDLASQVKKEPSKVSDGPTRPAKIPRKVKANKELEAGKSKWQEFSTKGKMGKAGKKDSMFRTSDSVTARVGFTGSGQEMRKDPARSRHIYQQHGDEDGN